MEILLPRTVPLNHSGNRRLKCGHKMFKGSLRVLFPGDHSHKQFLQFVKPKPKQTILRNYS
ncbi:hypothetical protein M5D96_005451 [Drosophila gunungcola]|uniref:Uncharacterized protein n=1 Tax=Drosophila gunungcola TaxID=103775 RepID=A0A9Q0BQT6_9MUSC|nr:hypothetical protein M5D96_005451 [Drosophila gunungcola]